ncbi:MAG: NEAT domain-containing protein, partial [bacterium]|nr:NEAT domain-containing protein [bacterium]
MRKIKYKIAAVAATAVMMFTTVMEPIVPAFAQGDSILTKSGKVELADGTYSINYSVLKETTDDTSSAGNYFEKEAAVLTVKDKTAKLRIVYSNSMIGNLHQVVGEEKEELKVTEDGEKKYVELTFNDLSEIASLYMEINTGTAFGTMKHIVRVVLDETTLKKDGVSNGETPSTGKVELADGTYSITYSVLKEDSDGTSNAGNYFDRENTVLTVKSKVAKLRLAYSDSMIGNLQQVVGEEKEVLTVTEDGTKKYVELTFNDLSEVGYLYMEINTGTSFGVMKHIVRIVLDQTTLKKDGSAVVVPGDLATPTPSPTVTPTTKPEQDNSQSLKDGVYETNAYLWHATSNQASMAGSAMEEVVRVSVKNGKSTMYIYTKEMNMGTIKAFLQELKVLSTDGTYKAAKVEAYDSNKNPICFSFEIPAYTEYINVKVNPMVALMGNQDIDARIKFDYQAMKMVSGTVNLTQSPSASTSGQTTAKPSTTVKP